VLVQEAAMAFPEVVSREQWRAARLSLLAAEKEETRRLDALDAERRRLPMVRIDKHYRFDSPQGPVPFTEMLGHSCFLRDGSSIFHTCSAFGRGNENTPSLYTLLDLTALGRQEAWEEPKDRAPVLH
jgi:predicted dithiol-disulfide oxidoreductase (DUF899 family)